MVDLCLLCIERQKGGELKMFCRKCGLKLKEGDKYCWKCGADIIVKPEDKSTVNSRWLTWVMIAVLICCAGIFVYQWKSASGRAKLKDCMNVQKIMNIWSSGEVNQAQQQTQEWMQQEELNWQQQQMQDMLNNMMNQ